MQDTWRSALKARPAFQIGQDSLDHGLAGIEPLADVSAGSESDIPELGVVIVRSAGHFGVCSPGPFGVCHARRGEVSFRFASVRI